MVKEIQCPGEMIYKLLDGLWLPKFRELQETDNYSLEDITARLKKDFQIFLMNY